MSKLTKNVKLSYASAIITNAERSKGERKSVFVTIGSGATERTFPVGNGLVNDPMENDELCFRDFRTMVTMGGFTIKFAEGTIEYVDAKGVVDESLTETYGLLPHVAGEMADEYTAFRTDGWSIKSPSKEVAEEFAYPKIVRTLNNMPATQVLGMFKPKYVPLERTSAVLDNSGAFVEETEG